MYRKAVKKMKLSKENSVLWYFVARAWNASSINSTYQSDGKAVRYAMQAGCKPSSLYDLRKIPALASDVW